MRQFLKDTAVILVIGYGVTLGGVYAILLYAHEQYYQSLVRQLDDVRGKLDGMDCCEGHLPLERHND